MPKKLVSVLGILAIAVSLLFSFFTRDSKADGTYSNIGTTSSSIGGSDAVSWSPSFPLIVDAYGEYLAPFEDDTGLYHIAVSTDKGSTWSQIDFSSSDISNARISMIYDDISDKIDVIHADTSLGGVTFLRYSIKRDSNYHITGIVKDFSMALENNTGCTAYYADNPLLLFKHAGTYGTLVAFWSVNKTCGGVSVTETRASMRVLTNTNADGTAANWAALNGVSDAAGATGPAAVPYNKLYGYNGAYNVNSNFQESAFIEGGNGVHANDIYYFNSDENDTNGFRRLAWNSTNGNWSGTWTSRVTFGGVMNESQGYSLKYQLLTKPVYDPTLDRVYVGISRWLDNTNGDTQSLFYVNSNDTVNLAANVYSAGGAHCLYPTQDIMYDATSGKVYIFYDISGSGTCGNVQYATFDGTTLSSPTAFYSAESTTGSVDIPIVYQSRQDDRILLFFRVNNLSTPSSPPHQIFFGYVSLNSTAVNPSLSGGTSPFTQTTYSDFNQTCATLTNSQVVNGSGGEVDLASSFRDDFETPRAPFTGLFSDRWSSGTWSAGTYNPTPNGTLLVYGSGGAYILGATSFNQKKMVFRAEFTNNNYQHIGWVDSTNFNDYIIFSTASNGQLNARVNAGGGESLQTLGTSYFGSYHTYEIDWGTSSEAFYIDGTLVATINVAVSSSLYPIASNNDTAAGSNLTLDWINVANYPATTGTYQSCSINSGVSGAVWGTINFTTNLPAGTSLIVETRTSSDNSTWTAWSSPITSGSTIPSTPGQYIEYRVSLTGTSADTPEFDDVTLTWSAPATPTPTATPTSTTAPSSSSSNSVSVVSAPVCGDTPPGLTPPYIYKVSVLGPNSLKVYFVKGDGPFDRYALIYGLKSNQYSFGALNLGDFYTSSILINDLNPSTTYFIRVRPDNGCAPGNLSNEVSATTSSSNQPQIAVTSIPKNTSVVNSENRVNPLPSVSPSPSPNGLTAGQNQTGIESSQGVGVTSFWQELLNFFKQILHL
jgi:hypothetical protein